MKDCIYVSPRLSTVETCPHCQHKITMISMGPKSEQRQCLKCHKWFDLNVGDMALPFVVARTIDILQQQSLRNVSFHEEDTVSSGQHVHQFRLEFEMPDKWRDGAASVRWFFVPERRDYQYLNKIWKGRVLNNGHLPAFVSDGVRDLTKKDRAPGTLCLIEASVNPQVQGRKFVRLEQNYPGRYDAESLIHRVELSWTHDPRDGIHPWSHPEA